MISVLGRGFGLYGHLPALIDLGFPVSTLDRYRPALQARPELSCFIPQISFIEDEEELVAQADVLVLARRPVDHVPIIQNLVQRRKDIRLVVEKPIAVDSRTAGRLHQMMINAGIRYHVPYLFPHCPWTRAIWHTVASRRCSVRLEWEMDFRNPAGSWKYDPGVGGGIVAYYAINFLPLVLKALGPAAPCRRVNYVEGRHLSFVASIGDVEILCRFAFRDEPSFWVVINGTETFRSATPFGESPVSALPDPRIGALQCFYRKEVFAQKRDALNHAQVIRTWDVLEDRSSLNPAETIDDTVTDHDSRRR